MAISFDPGSDLTTDPDRFSGEGWKRREFLVKALAALTGVALLPQGMTAAGRVGEGSFAGTGEGGGPEVGDGSHSRSDEAGTTALTIQQVIDLLQADIPGAPFKGTVDTVKSGDPRQPVKGIVTTMFATDAVIEKTIAAGANFIIAHEPTFYNHLDETAWLGEDKVLRFKKDLLEKHGIVVWRFHDGIHEHIPDGVRMGVLQALGWDKYYRQDAPPLIELPEGVSFRQMTAHLKKNLGIDKLKVIGDPAQVCRRIALAPGAAGGKSQIALLQKYDPDLLICGELNEWETSEYIRDARYQGQKTALIVLGHSVSEEPGMQWLIPYLQPKIPGIRITHIPSGDAFQWA